MHFYLAVRMTFMFKTEPIRTAITPRKWAADGVDCGEARGEVVHLGNKQD
jgi:hypothetical protein